jgi:hypothetical protein
MTQKQTAGGSVASRSKRPFRWAGMFVLGGCVACCAAPLMVALGIGEGALSALISEVSPWVELIAGGAAAAMVLGIVGIRGGQNQAPRCGCSAPTRGDPKLYRSGTSAPDEPIVCTADLRDQPTVRAQLDGYRAAFERLIATEHFPGGFRWTFQRTPELEGQLPQLAQSEHQCCRFFEFDVAVDGDRIVWQTTAAESARDVLEEFSKLPERLKAEHDVRALKRPFVSAGLTFAADREPVE